MLTREETYETVGLFLFEVSLFARQVHQLGEIHQFVSAGIITVGDLFHPLTKGLGDHNFVAGEY